MNAERRNLFIGLVLILIGGVSLLDNFRLFTFEPELFFGVLFIVGGYLFWGKYREEELARFLVLAGVLGYLGCVMLLSLVPGLDGSWEGVLFFVTVAAVSCKAYINDKSKWGLALLTGIALTLGGVVALETNWWLDGEFTGGAFFMGLAMTFGYLFTTRNEDNGLDWARLPAVILAALSMLLLIIGLDHSLGRFVFPGLLITTGAGLVLWNVRKRPAS